MEKFLIFTRFKFVSTNLNILINSKNHDKPITFLIILVVILSIILGLLFINNSITGQAIKENLSNNYSFTKAICDDEKYCQDHIINCNGNQVISITPITEAVVQFPQNWQDPRNQEDIDRLCD